MGNSSKMLGCRVPVELDHAIRELAEKEKKTVNDLMVEVLGNAFNGSTDSTKSRVTHKTSDVARSIQELKAQIKTLKESDDDGFLGLFQDEDIQACIRALKVEIRELVNTLPKPDNSEEDEDGDGFDLF